MTNPTPNNVFKTELEAVWYCANYYYKESYDQGIEFGGVIFKRLDNTFGYTIRKNGGFGGTQINWSDAEVNNQKPTAAWHTHLPSEACDYSQNLMCHVYGLNDLLFGRSYKHFSGNDLKLAERANVAGKKIYKQRIAIYLVTADIIRRYDPEKGQEKYWEKKAPKNMRLAAKQYSY